jgi:hypothetical protein
MFLVKIVVALSSPRNAAIRARAPSNRSVDSRAIV